MIHRLNFTDKTFDSGKHKTVTTFVPTVSFKPIPYKIKGLNDSCRVLGDRTLKFMVLDILFSILTKTEVRIKILSGKLKTMSHNF